MLSNDFFPLELPIQNIRHNMVAGPIIDGGAGETVGAKRPLEVLYIGLLPISPPGGIL